jgi:tetratricopeptide (TPR) repeat protein
MCHAALARQRELGDDEGQAWTLDSLGFIHWKRGDLRRAIDDYQLALGIFEKLADPYTERQTLIDLGDVYLAAGDTEAARSMWTRALGMMQADGHPEADLVRGRLAALG